MNIAALVEESAGRVPEKLAFLTPEGGTLTYGALDAEVDRVAAGLQSLGIARGDRVALGMHNVPQFACAYFGILRAGGVVVPLNSMLTPVEMGRVLTDSGATAALTWGSFGEAVRAGAEAASNVSHVLAEAEWETLAANGATPSPVEVTADDLAVLAYTSGTTGEPKGAMLTHGNLSANLHQQMSIPDAHVTEEDVIFLALPLFHIFGLNVSLGLLVMNGATGLLVERFEPIAALQQIQEHGVTVLLGAPTMYLAWTNTPGADQYDLSKVRLAISGAAPLSRETLDSFYDVFRVRVYEGYGLTETAPTLTSNRMGEEPRAGSIGLPLPEVELRLVDEDGKDVELGDPGEIVVRGPNVFKGYWNRPEETERAFREGWFRTGDVAVRDEEGYLYIVDRKRDLIIVSGFNVFPSEVENALVTNDKVAEAAVVGEPHPYTGEAVKAFVVLEEGASATEQELIADLQTRLARFKCPHSIEIVDALPHLLTGKVLRRALRT
ncbi:MAG TPA: long-chain fatty acid--CoA ligase [Actinomycetota bacterium]|jgi:long-chain acyl-CoA synthetase